ncbi:MAG TPA: phenylalanine--tRNA ligase subunit beta [archaeon]|jgi:phenylalanyl-tRNA synthetase beta chain|nr:phenylalanine--tRNA ligase subunit beta [archaeon]HRT02478.1 phenylalanine--tRNA ligase subunit beta [Candidatus Diapherotrites archaeon]
MATIDTKLEKIKTSLNKPELTLEQLEEILFEFGLEIDTYNPKTDEIKIEITAERTDLLSYEGLIRALKGYMGIEKCPTYKVNESGLKVIVNQEVIDYNKTYTLSAIIKDITLDQEKLKEIINFQEKLHLTYGRKRKAIAMGIYPLDKIKFPIYLLCKKPEEISFIPLGETKQMTANEILKNHPTGKEYAHLFEDKKKYTIFKDSDNQILSMPPIINSANTGRVTEKTKDLFIECTGNNLYKMEKAINMIVTMLADIGGKIYSLEISYPEKKIISPTLTPEKKIVSLKYMNKLLGTNIEIDTAIKILEKMLYTCKKIDKDKIEISIPPFRTDVLHDNDIADDLGRGFGFSNIPLRTPKIVTIGGKDETSIKQENIITIMTNMGFQEIMGMSLGSKKECFENFNIIGTDYIALGDTKEQSLNIITNWLTPKLLKTLINNQHRKFPQKIFSCDYIVKANPKKDVRSDTILHTAGMIANYKTSFSEIASVLLTLCNTLGLNLKLEKENYPYYIKGRGAKITINNKECGSIGELSPLVLEKNSYPNPVCVFEIEI